MDKKKCDKCGNVYDKNLDKCPKCANSLNDDFNINNPFLKLSKTYKEEKALEEEKKEPIEKKEDIILNELNIKAITEEAKTSKKEEKIEKQITIIEKKSVKKKKNSKNNSFFSYLLLILGMILLFIAILSTIIEFSLPLLCHYIGTVVVLMIAFNLTIRNKKIGYYFALLASISMICMFFECDYISAIIGVYIFTSSFVYLAKN